MLAVKGNFDGKRVVLSETPHVTKCPVIVVFEEDITVPESERSAWMRAQEAALAETWDNAEDAVYDRL